MNLKRVGLASLAVLGMLTGLAGAEPARRGLPFCAALAGDRELPLPCGITLLGYAQEHGYDIRELNASSPVNPAVGALVRQIDPAMIDVDNQVLQVGLKADAWLLPFLNVYGLLGGIDGRTDVDFAALPPAAAPVLGALDQGLDVDYAGLLYGVGGTLTWGAGPVFAAVNGILTWTELDEEEASVQAYILRPIIGFRADGFAAWTGLMYQKAQEEHKGRIEIPGFGPVDYDLEFEEKEPWNLLLGARYEFSARWNLNAEIGLGERMQAEAGLNYRF